MILGRKETKIIKHHQMQGEKPNIIVRSAYRDEWDDSMALAWRSAGKNNMVDALMPVPRLVGQAVKKPS